jgi:replication factor C small subunit
MKLEEIIGQNRAVEKIVTILHNANVKEIEEKKPFSIPHFLFVGPQGTGKTTLAQCLARAYFKEEFGSKTFIELNASDERGIKVVRETIKKKARVNSEKIIFLSEADNMTSDAQQALRRIMEKHSRWTKFILDGNYKNGIIPPIQSRCATIKFSFIPPGEMRKIIVNVLTRENIQFDDDISQDFITKLAESYGDARAVLNKLEFLIDYESRTLFIDEDELSQKHEVIDILNLCKQNDFNKAKTLINNLYVDNGYDFENIITGLFESIPQVFPSPEIQVRLFSELKDVYKCCTDVKNPEIPLTGFAAFCTGVSYMRKNLLT